MFDNIIASLKLLLPANVGILDFIQMVIIYIVLYYCIKTAKGTRAWILAKGVIIIGIVYLFFYITGMTVLQYIIQSLFSALMIAVIIMIQPELQKVVEKIGTNNVKNIMSLFKKNKEEGRFYSLKTIEETLQACETMSAAKTGALIVFERKIPLMEYANSGIEVNAKISSQLLINTFEKNTPLHDGAVIIKEDKLNAATCYLPLSKSGKIAKSLGTRHRAGIGISETTDAVVVIVSEETGAISICQGGKIYHNLTKAELNSILQEQSIKTSQITHRKEKKKKFSIWTCIAVAFLSVAIWSVTININDPVSTKTVYNIPVEILNEDVLEKAEQVYDIVQGSSVNVEVVAHRSILDKINENSIKATADFSEMSIVYAVPIKVSMTDTDLNAELKIKSDSVMKLQLEDMIQSEIAVSIKTDGEVAEGYYLNKATPLISSVIASGPKSIINTIGRAEALINIDNINSSTTTKSSITLYDKNGSVIDSEKVSLNESETKVDIEIYKTKSLKVIPKLADNKNYKMENYQIDDIVIAADNKILSSLSSINITIDPKQIDITNNKMLINLNLYLPDGVYLPPSQEETIEVSFKISKITPKATESSTATE